MQELPEEQQAKIFKRLDAVRSKGKSCNYSCQYGAGAT